jgi:hypothetical protein
MGSNTSLEVIVTQGDFDDAIVFADNAVVVGADGGGGEVPWCGPGVAVEVVVEVFEDLGLGEGVGCYC